MRGAPRTGEGLEKRLRRLPPGASYLEYLDAETFVTRASAVPDSDGSDAAEEAREAALNDAPGNFWILPSGAIALCGDHSYALVDAGVVRDPDCFTFVDGEDVMARYGIIRGMTRFPRCTRDGGLRRFEGELNFAVGCGAVLSDAQLRTMRALVRGCRFLFLRWDYGRLSGRELAALEDVVRAHAGDLL